MVHDKRSITDPASCHYEAFIQFARSLSRLGLHELSSAKDVSMDAKFHDPGARVVVAKLKSIWLGNQGAAAPPNAPLTDLCKCGSIEMFGAVFSQPVLSQVPVGWLSKLQEKGMKTGLAKKSEQKAA